MVSTLEALRGVLIKPTQQNYPRSSVAAKLTELTRGVCNYPKWEHFDMTRVFPSCIITIEYRSGLESKVRIASGDTLPAIQL